MAKLKSLITGALLGAGGMFAGLQYHIVQAPEGFLMIPRTPHHRLQDAYADVRNWDAGVWAAHPQLAFAVTEHGRADLIQQGTTRGLLDRVRESLTPLQPLQEEGPLGWEPVNTSEAPSPGTATGTGTPLPSSSGPKRGYLPLADLFGPLQKQKATDPANVVLPPESGEPRPTSTGAVLPTGSSKRPRVELLPSPDDVDLGEPAPLPEQIRPDRRRTDASQSLQTTKAAGSQGWEVMPPTPY
jgi:hypothetical protein